MLALFFLLLFLGSSAQAQDGSFPPELDDMMIIGDIGVSIDLLFDDNELAREKINEALDEDGISFADIVINFTRSDQLFWLITRQAPTADEVAAILAGMTGYWDQNGNWVQWVAPEPQTGSIYGYIVMYDAADQPDASAEVLVTVEAQNGQRYTAIVETFGDDGSYEYKYLLEGLAPDKYALVARADGYVPSETHVVTVEAGEQVGEVNFKLQRAEVTSSISGEVIMLDAGGQPDTGAAVEVTINCHTGYGPGYAHVVNSKDDGQYIYPYTIEMAPGEYTVYATATGYHYSEKQVVTVNEGDEITGVDFKLQKIAVPAKEVGSIQLIGFGEDFIRFRVRDTEGDLYDGTLDGAVTLRERDGHTLTSSKAIQAAKVLWDPNIASNGLAEIRYENLEMGMKHPPMPIEIIIETEDGKVQLGIAVTLKRETGLDYTPASIVNVFEIPEISQVGSIEFADFGDDFLRFTVKDADGDMYDGTVYGAVKLRERAGHQLADPEMIQVGAVQWDPNISSNGLAIVQFIDLEIFSTLSIVPITATVDVIIESDDGMVELMLTLRIRRTTAGSGWQPAHIEEVLLVIFEEDFTGIGAYEMPEGWRTAESAGTPDTSGNWYVHPSNEAGGTAPEMKLSFNPIFDGDSGLIAPVIDVSDYSVLQLTFRHYLNYWDFSTDEVSLGVFVSDDGEDIFEPVKEWFEFTGDIGPERVIVDLSDYAGTSSLEISWVFVGNSDNIWGWYIDDIELRGR